MDNAVTTVVSNDIATLLISYQTEARQELAAILAYWMANTKDVLNGGFIGKIDENNVPDIQAPKGSVLNSRILWAFSAAYKVTGNPAHLDMARVAFKYILTYFVDKEFGGVYWSVTASGQPLDTKKQIYALAFAVYGCSAYYEASGDETAKTTAIELYNTIEKYSFDEVNTGYLEAFTNNWQPISDLRLSDKDANEKKTMNTHLHVLEAYTALYKIWPDVRLKEQLVQLLHNFTQHIINQQTGHLNLFFDERWASRSTLISYGHDIEAAWLLVEAAEVINDPYLIQEIKNMAVKITAAAEQGIDKDGSLWYEYEPEARQLIKEKHWWVQAEAMVGFFSSWQITGNKKYLDNSIQAWAYTKTCIKDDAYGEWLWGRNADGSIMGGQDKAGMWKCPYHNSRACIEIINRITRLNNIHAPSS